MHAQTSALLLLVKKTATMADAPKRRTFRKFTFRGVDLEKLMDLDNAAVMNLMHARVRRRFSRGLKRKPMSLIKRLRKVRGMFLFGLQFSGVSVVGLQPRGALAVLRSGRWQQTVDRRGWKSRQAEHL